MPETEDQRKIRREASGWLTSTLNAGGFNTNLGSAVRGEVIITLSNLYSRLTEINFTLVENYHLRADHALVRFYMKGGNAFDCIRNPNGAEATIHGGGGSDWDTQIVIDPWAPLPLQETVYGLVEDIVLDEFRQASQRIAICEHEYSLYAGYAQDFVQETIQLWSNVPPPPPVPAPPLPQPKAPPYNGIYDLSYDDPQTLRKVYDREQLGLWTDTRQRLGDQNIDHPEWMAGQIYNAAIKPFELYRLGYTWHMKALISGSPDIRKPLLMELIDVTIPRRNTIEAVAVWEELAQDHIQITDATVNVNVLLPNNTLNESIGRDLPLPDIYYHLRELLTMMCEVADGSSHHADKIGKRFKRFALIWNNYNQARITAIMTDFVGCPVAPLANPPHNGEVYSAITRYVTDPADLALFGLGGPPVPAIDPAYLLAWKFMYKVECQTIAQRALPVFAPDGTPAPAAVQAFKLARAQLNRSFYLDWLSRSFSAHGAPTALASYAYSDDLVLIDTLLENAYLQPSSIRVSGVDQALVVRTTNYDQLQVVTGRFLDRFTNLAPASPQTSNFTVRHKLLQTTRPHGITHEAVFVIFDTNNPVACFTLTTATREDLPFLPSPAEGEAAVPRCPPGELARQRKVMAALIDNYTVKTAISGQYELLQEIITP